MDVMSSGISTRFAFDWAVCDVCYCGGELMMARKGKGRVG